VESDHRQRRCRNSGSLSASVAAKQIKGVENNVVKQVGLGKQYFNCALKVVGVVYSARCELGTHLTELDACRIAHWRFTAAEYRQPPPGDTLNSFHFNSINMQNTSLLAASCDAPPPTGENRKSSLSTQSTRHFFTIAKNKNGQYFTQTILSPVPVVIQKFNLLTHHFIATWKNL
jgi:hypothetical protein